MATFATNALHYRGIGSGIVRILSQYPDVDISNDISGKEFKVTIQRNVALNVADNVADELTDRQRVIFNIIGMDVADDVAVNTRYLANILGVNRKTIQRELSVLVEKDLIQWIGDDRSGCWQLKGKF